MCLFAQSFRLFAIPWFVGHQAPLSMGLFRQEYWSGYHSLLQGIFPTQGSNPGLLHCRRTLYQLSHKGSPGILEWVAFSFSSRSSRPRIKLGSPACRQIFYQLSYEGRSNRLPIKKKIRFHMILICSPVC